MNTPPPARIPRSRYFLDLRSLVAAALVLLAAAAAHAAGNPAAGSILPASGIGRVSGHVYDAGTGESLGGVSVVLTRQGEGDEVAAWSDARITDTDGSFAFEGLGEGTYTASYSREGYRDATVTEIVVAQSALEPRADFALPPTSAEAGDDGEDYVDEIVVTASKARALLDEIDLRFEADTQVNTLNAKDLARFAASDVADALKRVAGVNVVEGEFAIIRGLEDRYSSTTYNGAPLPSPDPDRQSVQLDLFPSDIVDRLVVSKTFGAQSPSNSSGGGLDIVTHAYPLEEGFRLKFSAGTGFNERARNSYLDFIRGGSSGSETNGSDVNESDYSVSLAGRTFLGNRELRIKALIQREVDYQTGEGFQETREPRPGRRIVIPPPNGTVVETGDLALGRLSLSGGRYDLTESARDEQRTAYVGFGLDLDGEGLHRVDGSILWSRSLEESVQHRVNGFLPGYDYTTNIATHVSSGFQTDDIFSPAFPIFGVATFDSWLGRLRDSPVDSITQGGLLNDSFLRTQSFRRDRELRVLQLNGEHEMSAVPLLDGLTLRWVVNRARTSHEGESLGTNLVYTNLDDPGFVPTRVPITVESRGAGGTFLGGSSSSLSRNDIRETQDFYRIDLEYVRDLGDSLRITVKGGWWRERAERDVRSQFLVGPSVTRPTCSATPSCDGLGSRFALQADSLPAFGTLVFDTLDLGPSSSLRTTENDSTRNIGAWSAESKFTLSERLDVIVGIRREDIRIDSRNDPFTTETIAGETTPRIFPVQYLFFDRFDNPTRPFEAIVGPGFDPSTATFNDQILGIDVPVDPATGRVDLTSRDAIERLVNGHISERRTLPSYAITLRAWGRLEGLTLRGAWSKTVARPSLRELGYYVSVERGTTDFVVGNPQLRLSDVRSLDFRVEYVWGDFRDFLSVSRFTKKISNPIESIVVRDPSNQSILDGASLFRTFFNNSSQATVRGWEFEITKNLGFLSSGLDLPWTGFLEYLTVDANYSTIDASVERSQAEIDRASVFYLSRPDASPIANGLARKRRLFGQPEWIANVNLGFDHPDWGTKFTLAWFAISDVLDSAGSAFAQQDGSVLSLTLDRYTKSFHQLDFIVSQDIDLERLPGSIRIEASVKNLTDSTRGLAYDPNATTGEIDERVLHVGRDYSFSISYALPF